MNDISDLPNKLSRNRQYRAAFVASVLKRVVPMQIRVLRKQRGWAQADLAKQAALTQGAISRAEDPNYGNMTLNNIIKIASGFDVAFVAKFISFSELEKWFSQVSEETLCVPSFEEDRSLRVRGHLFPIDRHPRNPSANLASTEMRSLSGDSLTRQGQKQVDDNQSPYSFGVATNRIDNWEAAILGDHRGNQLRGIPNEIISNLAS